MRNTFRRTMQLSACAYVFSRAFTVTVVKGKSMQPTLNPPESYPRISDIVLIEKITPLLLSYGLLPRGFSYKNKVVHVRHPTKNTMMLKRVREHHLSMPSEEDLDFGVSVYGDEPFYSVDSRNFGPIPTGLVKGVAMVVLWPFNRFGSSLAQNTY